MANRSTDVQLLDELATEAEELGNNPESGRVLDSALIEAVERKLKTIAEQPLEAYNRYVARCHLTEIDDAIKSEFFVDKPWDHQIRKEFFVRQLAVIESLKSDGAKSKDVLFELATFLRMTIIGLEKYRAHAHRR